MYLDLIPDQLKQVTRAEVPHPYFGSTPAGKRLLLNGLLPFRDPPSRNCPDPETIARDDPSYMPCRWEELNPSGIHLNLYHLFLFFGLLVLSRNVLRRFPLLPYHQNLQRIDDLLDSMSARTKVTERPTIWEPARWIYSLVADRVRETEREPFDPRTIELAFLHILEDIQRGGVRMPGIARRHLNLPAPEITFVFDELDKLETRLDPEDDRPEWDSAEIRALQTDQERSLRLRSLLSDLKNILASAPARFIFIGGRNLHDEWLADQTARQPLLTNIFIAEVYLPSLLADHSYSSNNARRISEGRHRLDDRVREYVEQQYMRSKELFKDWALKHFRPSYGLSAQSLSPERFAMSSVSTKFKDSEIYRVPPSRNQLMPLESPAHREMIIDSFFAFLTLRSMGNPKRLKELLGSFVRPVTKEIVGPARWRISCQHVLRLRDDEIFRIQLIASIYRQLAGPLGSRMVMRDDKMATSVFFLSDFLFKFHRRALSWANLERVDELAHIHRAPDLREIQEEMVKLVSERLLHRVLNGMYSFRFRSDIAREVEYLSRSRRRRWPP